MTTPAVAESTSPTPAEKPTKKPHESRLAFLDVLRGIAAMAVVLYHIGNQGVAHTEWFSWASHELLNLGSFGVLLFFVVSGFIIPASLERTGSLRDFWVSRAFRLFPLFWVVSAAVVVLYKLELLGLPGYIFKYKLILLVSNVSMMAHFLGGPFLIGPAWTLPFEMCFYLLTTVFFVTRLRGRSVGIALVGAGLALVATDRFLTTWPVTPRATGVDGHIGNPVRVVVLAIVFATVMVLLAKSRWTALYAGVVAFGASTLLMNRPWPLHQAVIYITIMCTGTVIYRMWDGQLDRRKGWAVVGTVVAACCVSYILYTEPLVAADGTGRGAPGETWWTRSVALVAAVAVFTIFFALRDRVRWPAALAWLGRISYSVYLVHWVVMRTVPPVPEWMPARGLVSFLVWVGVSLGISQLTYMFVEKPAIDAGRRVTAWLRARDQAAKQRATIPKPRVEAVEEAV